MSYLIVGGEGNMGRRYRAILDFLGKPYKIADIKTPLTVSAKLAKDSDGIIIATPTITHSEYLHIFHDMGVPILCEKPLSTDLADLKSLLVSCGKAATCIDMVFQYKHLPLEKQDGPSYYNYFKHGSDGLVWDCIQIVGLARGPLELKEESPIWQCKINGNVLDIADMDMAYLSFIRRWIKRPGQDIGEIWDVHQRTARVAAGLDGYA